MKRIQELYLKIGATTYALRIGKVKGEDFWYSESSRCIYLDRKLDLMGRLTNLGRAVWDIYAYTHGVLATLGETRLIDKAYGREAAFKDYYTNELEARACRADDITADMYLQLQSQGGVRALDELKEYKPTRLTTAFNDNSPLVCGFVGNGNSEAKYMPLFWPSRPSSGVWGFDANGVNYDIVFTNKKINLYWWNDDIRLAAGITSFDDREILVYSKLKRGLELFGTLAHECYHAWEVERYKNSTHSEEKQSIRFGLFFSRFIRWFEMNGGQRALDNRVCDPAGYVIRSVDALIPESNPAPIPFSSLLNPTIEKQVRRSKH